MNAYFSKKLENKFIKCLACAHGCVISPGSVGICNIRRNNNGSLILDAYGCAASFGVDNIEKKPLFHFIPGSSTFSFGTLGCNFKCVFCQNFSLSMPRKFVFKKNLSPEHAVKLALQNNCKSISYTYNEPAIFLEYAIDTAKLARTAGLKNVLVTNGFFSEVSLIEVVKFIDAVNIDLKSFNDEFYKIHCKARLDPVLRAIKFFHEKGVWVEVTTLVIPNLNDSSEELRNIARFIASVDKNIPWHISRFFPMHKLLDRECTPISKIDEAVKIGREEGLNFIYKGNISEQNITFCKNCNKELILRTNNKIDINIKNNKCACGKILRGVF